MYELGGDDIVVGDVEELVTREEGRLTGSHVGEDRAAVLLAWVGELVDALVKRPALSALRTPRPDSSGHSESLSKGAPLRLPRLLEAVPLDVVQPAVVDATEPAILQAAIAQIGAAMRAVDAQQSRPALLVAEENKIFTEEPDGQRGTPRRKLLGEGGRLPVPAHQLAARRSRTNTGQQLVFFMCPHS